MAEVPDHFFRQSGVIAFRRKSAPQILLVSSSKGKRWVVPKGVIELDMTPWESAAKEAFEEAGVHGTVSPQSLGSYRYQKWGGVCVVELYPLRVTKVLNRWPESFRKRKWLDPADAARLVDEPELRRLLRDFDALAAVPE